MGAVKDMMMDVEEFVYDFYDANGQLTESFPYIVAKTKEKFGYTFAEYAKDLLTGDEYPTEPNYMPEEIEYRKSLAQLTNDEIPF